ncbi:MAG: PTS sugar transporter subunit IIA [Colwellia sp.]|nr:PTS sugar transporter subunit IIA [Colwellia sp.]
MKLQDILTLDSTCCCVPINSKKRILEKICSLAVNKIPDLDQHQLLDSLMEREKMGSTGIGNGIAIPHGRLNNTQQVIAVLITSEQAIDFDAIDNRSVDIFIALFVPEDSCDEHLSTLQSIAKLFSNKNNGKLIRKCRTNEQLFGLIQTIS